MECRSAMLPSSLILASRSTTEHWLAFNSKVCKNGSSSWLVLSPSHSTTRIVDLNHTNFNAHVVLRRRAWSSTVKLRPILGICAAVDDSSSRLPSSVPGEHPAKDHNSQKDGLLQWLRYVVARRISQKEKLSNSLKRYGVAGILSYGVLNTIYYLLTFLFVWFYVAPSPGGLGLVPAAQRFGKVFATVWAGSQVTKILRAAGALSLAPFVDRGLTWFTHQFNFKSRGAAFSFLVGACFGLAGLVFLVITALWS